MEKKLLYVDTINLNIEQPCTVKKFEGILKSIQKELTEFYEEYYVDDIDFNNHGIIFSIYRIETDDEYNLRIKNATSREIEYEHDKRLFSELKRKYGW